MKAQFFSVVAQVKYRMGREPKINQSADESMKDLPRGVGREADRHSVNISACGRSLL